MRDQFFPSAGRPCDDAGAVMRRHAADLGKHFPHQRAAADHALELAGFHQFVVEHGGAPLPTQGFRAPGFPFRVRAGWRSSMGLVR